MYLLLEHIDYLIKIKYIDNISKYNSKELHYILSNIMKSFIKNITYKFQYEKIIKNSDIKYHFNFRCSVTKIARTELYNYFKASSERTQEMAISLINSLSKVISNNNMLKINNCFINIYLNIKNTNIPPKSIITDKYLGISSIFYTDDISIELQLYLIKYMYYFLGKNKINAISLLNTSFSIYFKKYNNAIKMLNFYKIYNYKNLLNLNSLSVILLKQQMNIIDYYENKIRVYWIVPIIKISNYLD